MALFTTIGHPIWFDPFSVLILLLAVTTMSPRYVTSQQRRRQQQQGEDEVIMDGHTVFNMFRRPLPYTYIHPRTIPQSFSWSNVNGR